MNFINLNGKVQPAEEPALLVSNRSFRYGDGLFETMKLINGRIMLNELHFERLFTGMNTLKMEVTSGLKKDKLQQEIHALCKKNGCENLARVRLTVFRSNGGLYDENQSPCYVIECWPLDSPINELNANGLVIDIFLDARKSSDKFSSLKSSSHLLYAVAAVYAKENRLNDCLVLNTEGNIADSTIANIFLIRNSRIITPALAEGCVAGVMRRHLIEVLNNNWQPVEETRVTVDDVLDADEVFLTNAIKNIRWVRQFRDKIYTNQITAGIYRQLMKTILT